MNSNKLRANKQSQSENFSAHGGIVPPFAVAQIAAQVGIDWYATSKNIDLRDGAKVTGRWCVPLDPRDKGKLTSSPP